MESRNDLYSFMGPWQQSWLVECNDAGHEFVADGTPKYTCQYQCRIELCLCDASSIYCYVSEDVYRCENFVFEA